jgi:ParB family chromosome partitioning protein
MALDLSALEEKPVTQGAVSPSGKPLDLLISDVEEDPDQPRKEFTEEAMQDMIASIKARGVKTPVSVRPHPTKPGKWMLNYGARRYRGSIGAGKQTIPAFIDEAHDDYDQVIENIQRDDLKPMELALFIKRKLDAGDKKGVIAKRLGKDAAAITRHMALIDPPACIEEIYITGKCVSPQTLSDLRNLHEKYPEQVEAWCGTSDDITRNTVLVLGDTLKGKKPPTPSPAADGESSAGFVHEQISGAASGGDAGDGAPPAGGTASEAGKPTKEKPAASGADKGNEAPGEPDHGELTSWPKGRAVSDPERMNKPLLLVEIDGRAAAVLLNRRPSAAGLIRVRYEDGGGDAEVEAGLCKINLLVESEK